MTRRLLTVVSAFSLLLCAGTAALYGLAAARSPEFSVFESRWELTACLGALELGNGPELRQQHSQWVQGQTKGGQTKGS